MMGERNFYKDFLKFPLYFVTDCSFSERERERERQRDRQRDRQTDRQTDRQSERENTCGNTCFKYLATCPFSGKAFFYEL